MSEMDQARALKGRLVLEDAVVPGRIEVTGDRISSVAADSTAGNGPLVCPGFVDVHIHGWAGHDAMGGPTALDGMSRALLARGITAFLPTAVTAPSRGLRSFAEQVAAWSESSPTDGATPLGFNLEGPCISHGRPGAQNPEHIQEPSDYTGAAGRLVRDGLRIMTVAPERPGALELIEYLSSAGVIASLGHSDATAAEAAAGYLAGARTTTHLFNAMSAIDHHAPGLAMEALSNDAAYVELVADGLHVDPALWPLLLRMKPADRLILVSDAIPFAGLGDGRFDLGGVPVKVAGGACRTEDGGKLAGSISAIDEGVRNLVASGVSIPAAVGAASRNPLALLGVHDRGRIAPGQIADLLVLDGDLAVDRVMKAGVWVS